MSASLDETQETKNLSQLFEDGYALFEDVSNSDQPTNSTDVQVKIRRCMKLFEDATRLVSVIGMFSRNESVEEIATNDLKFFLLPALLGMLSLKITSPERLEIVQTADIYFRDYVQRCKDYGITDVELPNSQDESESMENGGPPRPSRSPANSLIAAAQNRSLKIQRYNEQKALKTELEAMKSKLNHISTDDDFKRKYYINLIKSYITQSTEELESLNMEKQILKHMEKMKRDGSLGVNEERQKLANHPKPKPLKPVIITKDEFQKKVFGAGYPSLPTMTVEEFYEQRVREGIFPASGTTLQGIVAQGNTADKEEQEAAEKEAKIEQDDEEMLARARSMDEYKDAHRRGWGNRYNRS